MKKTIILALLAIATAANAQDNDTLVIHNPRKVTIVTNDSLQKITVVGKEGDDKFTYQSTIQIVDSNYVSHHPLGENREDQRRPASQERNILAPGHRLHRTHKGRRAHRLLNLQVMGNLRHYRAIRSLF